MHHILLNKHLTHFNPLSLYRERPGLGAGRIPLLRHFNPLSLYRERHFILLLYTVSWYFNPLSLYRERLFLWFLWLRHGCISIHSPYTGRDLSYALPVSISLVFQSTLPIQGETVMSRNTGMTIVFQSTLPIQGETRAGGTPRYYISIFQSTLPIQGETSVSVP